MIFIVFLLGLIIGLITGYVFAVKHICQGEVRIIR